MCFPAWFSQLCVNKYALLPFLLSRAAESCRHFYSACLDPKYPKNTGLRAQVDTNIASAVVIKSSTSLDKICHLWPFCCRLQHHVTFYISFSFLTAPQASVLGIPDILAVKEGLEALPQAWQDSSLKTKTTGQGSCSSLSGCGDFTGGNWSRAADCPACLEPALGAQQGNAGRAEDGWRMCSGEKLLPLKSFSLANLKKKKKIPFGQMPQAKSIVLASMMKFRLNG